MKYLNLILLLLLSESVQAKECVVLLHGLARSSSSMASLQRRLQQDGYVVRNIDYPSRKLPIEALAELAVGKGIAQCKQQAVSRINFVTHSLGGILLRVYAQRHPKHTIARAVMLGPPNQGSEVVDHLKHMPGFEFINGPAGMQLGSRESDVPKSLGAVDFELGVIAGTQSINLILSTFLPNPDDGKVSVKSTKVAGMQDFITLPTTHPFMMKNAAVIKQTLHFLKHGQFSKRQLHSNN